MIGLYRKNPANNKFVNRLLLTSGDAFIASCLGLFFVIMLFPSGLLSKYTLGLSIVMFGVSIFIKQRDDKVSEVLYIMGIVGIIAAGITLP